MTGVRNRWIQYVRAYQGANPGISWKKAMQEAAPLYREQKLGITSQSQLGGASLSSDQLQKMIGLAVRFLGKDSFYGIDPKTIMDFMNFLFNAQDFAGALSRISESNTTNPWTESISSISFNKGPEGVRTDMQKVFRAIDEQPDSQKIYQTLCAVYRDILFDSTGIFSQIISNLYPVSPAKRDALKTQIIYAVQSLNFEELAGAYRTLPVPLQGLLKDPEKLRGDLEMILNIISRQARLGSFVGSYLDPVLNTAISAVQQVVPLTFAMMILLERCEHGITEAQEVALDTLVPSPTGSPPQDLRAQSLQEDSLIQDPEEEEGGWLW